MQFRQVPHSIFPGVDDELITPNRLVLRLQPDEGVRLHLVTKQPGPGGIRLHPAELNLSFAETFKSRVPDAYERLLMDVVQGHPTLFMRRDEVETAWAWIEPILRAWDDSGHAPKTYPAGTGRTRRGHRADRARRPHLARGDRMTHPVVSRRHPTSRPNAAPPTRAAYLERVRAAAQQGPARGGLGCANLAHGFAASGADKDELQARGQAERRDRVDLQRHALGAPAVRPTSRR